MYDRLTKVGEIQKMNKNRKKIIKHMKSMSQEEVANCRSEEDFYH